MIDHPRRHPPVRAVLAEAIVAFLENSPLDGWDLLLAVADNFPNISYAEFASAIALLRVLRGDEGFILVPARLQ